MSRMKDLLNPYQWNSLRITLLIFEENLRRAQSWLDGKEEAGTLYQRKLTLPTERGKLAEQQIKAALNQIAELSRLFDLQKEIENSASQVSAEMTVSWANLLDSRAGKLARYGDVHPELPSLLDRDIQHLAEIARNLSAIFGETQQEKR